jgi:fatty-acyl-CoA synthase
VGGTVVLCPRFDADGFLDALAEERCTRAFAVPTQLVMLRDSRRWGVELPALRRFMAGGAPCPPALADAVRASGYGLREGYGLTECGPNCFAISDEEAARRPGRVGWPVPFLEMRLAADGGRDARPGEPGELLLRGPQLFGGYLHSPERTAEVMAPGGWLRTGDLAVRDADGAYAICGRRKEMFISGGENVFPGEVEAALADHPAVAEVVVVGVPDERWGELGCAFVVQRPESQTSGDDVARFARGRLAAYKVPRRVVFLAELPRLGSGKPDRRALAELAGGRSEVGGGSPLPLRPPTSHP